AQWLVVINRLDICFAVSSLSRFNCAPREGHLTRALRVWGYLKQHKGRRILFNSRPPKFDPLLTPVMADFTENYPDAMEEIDTQFPKPHGQELDTTILFDSDHAHDTVTRRSITGILIFVGSTPVHWISKRQGAIETSTYGAEFNAMRTAAEETIALRYMLRSLGVPVSKPTDMMGNNIGVIQNASNPEGLLKKKHTALSFHRVRECNAAGILSPYHIPGVDNHADILTKVIPESPFNGHVSDLMCGQDRKRKRGS
ncbi:MAG: Ty1/Copia family ribonuclease HI, partial [Gloeomargaritales cyanobacterium]